MDALRSWALACYQLGLRRDAVFRRGGALVIRWAADKRGELLYLDFAQDSFRGWELTPAGETLAECITRHARAARDLRWSAAGTAPLRFSPESQPASSAQ
jgi:hypothetical protein